MTKKFSKIRRALVLSAPFLFIALAVYFFSVGAFAIFVESNPFYRLLTNSPEELSANIEDSYLNIEDFTEEELQILEENSEGMPVKKEFPAIFIGQQWANITIESAGVYDIPVFHGDSEDLLLRGVGHSFNSRFPGQNGRIVLPAHVGISRFFQRLETVNVGDTVYLNTIYGEYVYRVVETVIFDQNDISYVLPLEEETADQLVCYTCYPYHTTSERTQRFAIICEKVSGEDWTAEGEGEG